MPLKAGQVEIKYMDGKQITDLEVLKGAKLSFHASGIINVSGTRAKRESLREINE